MLNVPLKTVEDMPGGYVANVMKTFSVSQSLAEKYGAIVMLGSLRFGKIQPQINFHYFLCSTGFTSQDGLSCVFSAVQ